MGTKKGQRRKTARRAYEPRRPQKSKKPLSKREKRRAWSRSGTPEEYAARLDRVFARLKLMRLK